MRRTCLYAVAGLVLLCFVGGAGAQAPLYSGSNVLAAVLYNDGPGSSDMTLIIKLTADDKVLLDEGSPIKYIQPTANIDGWTKAEFDDSKWSDGVSGIGFDDNDDNTPIPARSHVAYVRYRFTVADAMTVKVLTLLVDYDDAYVAWLNGVEIGRSASMAAGGAKAGEIPPWDYGADAARIGNHGSTEMAKGNPNAARWAAGAIEKVDVKFTPMAAAAVSPRGKLAATWGAFKAKF
jgi:hypothetical protein